MTEQGCEQLLRKIVNLTAMRGFHRDPEWNETILDCIQGLLTRAGFGVHSDVL